jgi:hypothetical protein
MLCVRREGVLVPLLALPPSAPSFLASPSGVRIPSSTPNILSASLRGTAVRGSLALRSSILMNPSSGSQTICFFLADPVTDPISLPLSCRSRAPNPPPRSNASDASLLPNLALTGVFALLSLPPMTEGAAEPVGVPNLRALAKSFIISSPSEGLPRGGARLSELQGRVRDESPSADPDRDRAGDIALLPPPSTLPPRREGVAGPKSLEELPASPPAPISD